MTITLKQLRAYEQERQRALKWAEIMCDQGNEAGALGVLADVESNDREMAPAARALGYELQ